MSSLEKQNQSTDRQANLQTPIPCAFHKDKKITNFCSSQSCLLPMCPVCIAIHSQQHRQENTHGQFQSIQQIIQYISALLLKANKSLQDMSEQYTEDYWSKQKLLQSCKQILYNHKKKLFKQIERRFEEIEHKLVRKINEFQDQLHDQYKSLESEIQYLYDSINKQREELCCSNDKILKNVICFYSQKKQQKIKEWQNKFRVEINQLKKSSIRLKCNDQLFEIAKSIQYFFNTEEFKDQENEFLVSTGRQLISSSTKRKQVESSRFENDKENYNTVRFNFTNRNPEGLNQTQVDYQNDHQHWSACKF